jgi:chromate reductase
MARSDGAPHAGLDSAADAWGVGGWAHVREGRIEIAAIVGSLRRQSYNRGLLRTAMLLQPEEMRLAELSIATLPFFNEDVEATGDPPLVRDFKDALRRADGVLICSPEYGYSIPGALKNALDWASRPSGRSVVRGKPVALLGASIGRSGTMRAQLHLRQIFLHMGAVVIPEPEVFVTFAPDKFNQLGELTDHTSRELMRQLLANLADWAVLLRDQR